MARGLIRFCACHHATMGSPSTSDEWQTSLLLPDHYTVVQVEKTLDQFGLGDIFAILVESEAIPVVEDASRLEVTPFYRRDERGRTMLEKIDFNLWNGEKWEQVKNAAS